MNVPENFQLSWQQMVAILDAAVFIYRDGSLVYVNEKTAELVERSPEEIIGQPFWEFLHPERRNELKERGAARERGEVMLKRDLVRLITRSGRPCWAEVSMEQIEYGGQPAIFGTVLDATERVLALESLRQSELLFRSLTENTPVAIFIHQGGHIVYANPAFSHITRYPHADILRMDFWTFIHPAYREIVKQRGTQRLDGENPPSGHQVKFVRKDGSEGWVELMGSPVEFQGAPAVLGTAVDVTEQRAAEEEFTRAQKLESIGILAGGVAHDFNNIITSVLANISYARLHASTDPDKAIEKLEAAEKAAVQSRELTQQLLTFSRGGAPVRKPLCLAPLIQESLALALSGASTGSQCDIAPDLWRVEADQGQLRQVLCNLVINANQSMSGSGMVRISAHNTTLENAQVAGLNAGPYVRISVQDEGKGIPKSILPKIFDPYFTTKPGGTGLGLATAYSIVNRHMGSIQVESSEGTGSVFHVYLPATRRSASPTATLPNDPRSGSGRVLLMDDDEKILEIVASLLDHLGYKTETARDGEEALSMYRDAMDMGTPFDIVIMDLTIQGGMGGQEAVKKLREWAPDARVIVSSGYCNDPVMADHRAHGFDAVISKPFTAEELSRVLKETC